ncbi:TSUP family transporter [Nocardioides soli]|uniref:Probable membrane transporter protein n=1 Tax=Nocardioides soli TaxID=1036020 RepID=A0A7W4Z4Y7_9ACTN|nr:hypothetical protein [Nocardioides soli]
MDGVDQALVVLAGFGAGILTSSVGVASLLSFPFLLAVGLPPVTANVSNTIGLVPGGLGGAVGYREELRAEPAITRQVIALTGVAGAVGAALLLALPPGVFEAIVPWLILVTCLVVGAQPRISRWLAVRRERAGHDGSPRVRLSPVTILFVLLTGVYGGYFGAGAGVMMIATLALGLDIDLRVIGGIRTASLLASNLVAAVIFTVVADVDWAVVGLLAVSSIVGGYVGARVARRMSVSLLRSLVVVAGVVASGALLFG